MRLLPKFITRSKGRRAKAHDLPAVVDATGNAEPELSSAREGSQIGHLALLPQESVGIRRGRHARAHDLPAVVDVIGSAKAKLEVSSAGQHPEIGYRKLCGCWLCA